MPISRAIRPLALAVTAGVVTAACAAQPRSEPPAYSWSAAPGLARADRESWTAPDAPRASLLYVSDIGTNDVAIYSYPEGVLKGVLKGLRRPSGLCVDASGNVFVTELDAARITEFAHGHREPIARLQDPREDPGACSVDPVTGNLAVANVSTPYSGAGDVAIYKHARGLPKRYADAAITYYEFCGYDTRGNLYVDGVRQGVFGFAVLVRTAGALRNVELDEKFRYAGNVAWDGTHVVVGNYETGVVYQFRLHAGRGTKVGSTTLERSNFPVQFWIQGATIIGPNDDGASVMFWHYPAGGRPTKKIPGLDHPWGATVSLAR